MDYAQQLDWLLLGGFVRRCPLLAGLQQHFAAMSYVVLSAIHVILQVSKCQLRLNHPEFCQVARCVAVLSPASQALRFKKILQAQPVMKGMHRAHMHLQQERQDLTASDEYRLRSPSHVTGQLRSCAFSICHIRPEVATPSTRQGLLKYSLAYPSEIEGSRVNSQPEEERFWWKA